MRTNRDDTRPAVPADGNDQIICAIHRARRLAKFCVCKPVYNADHVVIDYTYECNGASQCKNRDGSSREVPPTPSIGTVNVAPDAEAAEAAPVRMRVPNRYYDLANQRVGAGAVKKVCWHCGMEGHEKPECSNILCRVCHTIREHHHICQESSLSSFVVLTPSLPLVVDMTAVRCVTCFEMGHMDCSKVTPVTSPTSCCFCGETGHSAYECRRRQMAAPDRWYNRVQDREWAVGNGGPPNSHAYTNVQNSFSGYGHQHGNPSPQLYNGDNQSPRSNHSASWGRKSPRHHWENDSHAHHHTDRGYTDHHKGHHRSHHGEHHKDDRRDYHSSRHRDYQRNSYGDYQRDSCMDYHHDKSRDYRADGQRHHTEHRYVDRRQEDRDTRDYSRGNQGTRRHAGDAVDASRYRQRFRHEPPQPYRDSNARDTQGHRSQMQPPRRARRPYDSDNDAADIF